MNERYIDPKEYLDKHLEPKAPEKFDFSKFENLSFIKGSTPEIDEEGSLEYQNGDFRLSFCQEAVPDEAIQEIRANAADKDEFDTIFHGEEVSVLRSFEMVKGQTRLDIEELIPESIILLLSGNKDADEQVNSCFGGKLLVVTGDLTKVKTVASLLHEALHTDHEVNPSRSSFNNGDMVSKKESALILQQERDAGVFVLKKLQPFLDQNDFRTLYEYIHKHDLFSYSQKIRGATVPDWLVKMTRFIDRKIAEKTRKAENEQQEN